MAQKGFFDGFSIRQSFQSPNYKSAPASIAITKPVDTTASWMLNLAIGYNILHKSKNIMRLDPFVEFHKNTLITKKQDNWQAGLSFEWQTIKLDLSEKRWSPIIISGGKYNDDRIKQNTSFQANIYFTFLPKQKSTGAKYFYMPDHPVDFGRVLRFEYIPTAGLESESRIKTAKDSAQGYIIRLYGRVTTIMTLFPGDEKPGDRFEFNVDYQYRKDLSKSVKTVHRGTHNYFTAGLSYTFFKSKDAKKSARIGFDYVSGENPTQNFEEQSFCAVSLKLKI